MNILMLSSSQTSTMLGWYCFHHFNLSSNLHFYCFLVKPSLILSSFSILQAFLISDQPMTSKVWSFPHFHRFWMFQSFLLFLEWLECLRSYAFYGLVLSVSSSGWCWRSHFWERSSLGNCGFQLGCWPVKLNRKTGRHWIPYLLGCWGVINVF